MMVFVGQRADQQPRLALAGCKHAAISRFRRALDPEQVGRILKTKAEALVVVARPVAGGCLERPKVARAAGGGHQSRDNGRDSPDPRHNANSSSLVRDQPRRGGPGSGLGAARAAQECACARVRPSAS